MGSALPHYALYGPTPSILLTNDDGVHPQSALILPLAQKLVQLGHDVVVCAPGKNNSACGHGITLSEQLTIRRHRSYETSFAPKSDAPPSPAQLHVFSIDEGTPADCVIAAIQPETGLLARLGRWPRLTLSGVNYGQNMGSDIIYSGTFAAARQAAMYGIPAVASSVDLFKPDHTNPSHIHSCERAIHATLEVSQAALAALPEQPYDLGRLRPADNDAAQAKTMRPDDYLKQAFARGNIVLNLNVPTEWKGEFQTTRLDCVMYRSPISLPYLPNGLPESEEETLSVKIKGSTADYMHVHRSDTKAVSIYQVASITPVSTWPLTHPLALSDAVLGDAIKEGLSWVPSSSKVRQVETVENDFV